MERALNDRLDTVQARRAAKLAWRKPELRKAAIAAQTRLASGPAPDGAGFSSQVGIT